MRYSWFCEIDVRGEDTLMYREVAEEEKCHYK